MAYVYDQFCIKRLPLPTEREILLLENRLQRNFPDVYREFLLTFNGGRFRDCGITNHQRIVSSYGIEKFLGITNEKSIYELGNPGDYLLFDDNDPPVLLPIATFGDSSFLMIDLDDSSEAYGSLVFKKASGDFYSLYSSFSILPYYLNKEPWLRLV